MSERFDWLNKQLLRDENYERGSELIAREAKWR